MNLLAIVTILLLSSLCKALEVGLKQQWKSFKELHNKSYDKLEEVKRLHIFKDNLKKIEEHNRLYQNGKSLYKMGITKFADLTTEEFTTFVTKKPSITGGTIVKPTFFEYDVAESVDWREQGAVSEVKDQGECSGSWIFAITDVIESRYFINVDNSSLVLLSTQELLDCAYNSSCSGGLIQDGYSYTMSPGLVAEADYPSTGNGTCLRNESVPSAITVFGYAMFSSIDDEMVAQQVAQGPLVIVVDASNWQLYDGGIMECDVPPVENHGAFLIGYGVEEVKDYWLIKNSWGTNWGEEGYIRVARNTDANCGVNTEPSFVIFQN